jgi:hypothetical protein
MVMIGTIEMISRVMQYVSVVGALTRMGSTPKTCIYVPKSSIGVVLPRCHHIAILAYSVCSSRNSNAQIIPMENLYVPLQSSEYPLLQHPTCVFAVAYV